MILARACHHFQGVSGAVQWSLLFIQDDSISWQGSLYLFLGGFISNTNCFDTQRCPFISFRVEHSSHRWQMHCNIKHKSVRQTRRYEAHSQWGRWIATKSRAQPCPSFKLTKMPRYYIESVDCRVYHKFLLSHMKRPFSLVYLGRLNLP